MTEITDKCFVRRYGEDPLKSWVTASSGFPKLILLNEVRSAPRFGLIKIYSDSSLTFQQLEREIILPAEKSGDVVALDFETKGTEPLDVGCEIVGVGLSWKTGTAYVDLTILPDPVVDRFLDSVVDRLPLLAHNVMFDGRWIYTRMGRHANFQACTYALYKYLATEGFPDQQWSLKSAMKQCLGWGDTNERELDNWLVREGWISGAKWGAHDDMTEEEHAAIRERVLVKLAEGKNYRPIKGEMWRAPAEILGHYCALDADATYQFYTKVLRPAMNRFPEFKNFFENYVMRHIEILIEQINYGIPTDVDYLEELRPILQLEIDEKADVILSFPEVIPHLLEWNQRKIWEVWVKQPEKYLKEKDPGPEPEKWKKGRPEPKKFTKAGQVSKTWLVWKEKEELRLSTPSKTWEFWVARRQKYDNPTISKNWLAWKEKYDEARGRQHFKLSSPLQLQWLLYEKLYQIREIEPFQDKRNRGSFELLRDGKIIAELDYSEHGGLPTDKTAFGVMGELGRALGSWKKSVKELEFVEQFLGLEMDGVLHPQWRAPGTLTGRLAGKSPNFQQCWVEGTELLTRHDKWKKIEDITMEDEIWQIDPKTRQGSWCRPSYVFMKDYDGEVYRIGTPTRGYYEVTPDHRLLFYKSTRPDTGYYERRAEEGPARVNEYLRLSSFDPSITSQYSEEDIWMACMIQADGSSDRQKRNPGWRFGFGGERKKQKATELIGRPHQRAYTNKHGTEVWYWDSVKFNHPLLTSDKSFDLSTLGPNQVETFIAALQFWDGESRGTKTRSFHFYSDRLDTIEEVQIYLIRSGWQARIISRHAAGRIRYTLMCKPDKGMAARDSSTRHYQGRVGCVTVETGFVLIRSGGQTFLTGQCFKKARLLDCFQARPGHVWVQIDYDALENKLLAEFTRDQNLLELYASDKPHDGYMFIGQSIGDMRRKFEEAGYDFKNPTKEGVAKAKKLCKAERNVCKVTSLSKQYGGGVGKIYKTLKLAGEKMSFDEVREICEGYDKTFPGVKRLDEKLKKERRNNRGWIMNSRRPLGIGPTKEKDVVNMRIQSEGHDRLTIAVVHVDDLIRRARIPGGWVYSDFHDEWCFETPVEHAHAVADIYRKVFDDMNRAGIRSGEIVPLTGTPEFHLNMSGIKVENYEYPEEMKKLLTRLEKP